ncbi:hypothetical protein [Sphingosinicella sp. BN140058]|uniref:hypothetical protein n=1 Tax=Sphingosinicella sp. BN140058 TaxID=1892855 RepID=UPI001012F27C|nr:hypothetical protein [Sphingosinicella sp. BN140058]QAY78276.1 hypothetical protein ETR14_18345 [Sphingosinicella sp. BN140058]
MPKVGSLRGSRTPSRPSTPVADLSRRCKLPFLRTGRTMGYSISWLAVRNMSKVKLLRRLQLTDTGEPDEDNEAPLSAADLPTGWAILFSNDFSFGSRTALTVSLAENEVIVCQADEHVMFSSVSFFSKGRQQWSVAHDAQQDLRHLEGIGALPEQLSAIRVRLMDQLEEEGGDGSEVDYTFEIPVELAEHLTGYRHDRDDHSSGRPNFTAVVGNGGDAPKAGRLRRLIHVFRAGRG